MTSKFLVILVVGLVVSFTFYYVFGSSNITGVVIAKTIPRYPNATFWRFKSSNGFMVGAPYARISSETSDTRESVFNFYKTELGKRGWKLKSDKTEPMDKWIAFEKDFGEGNRVIRSSISINVAQSMYKKVEPSRATYEGGNILINLSYETY